MTPEEYGLVRQKLGWTDNRLAAELHVTDRAVRAWNEGRLAIPERDARWLRWHVGVAERKAALAASGLPECPWMKAWEAKPLPDGTAAVDAHFKALDQHAGACQICADRERYVRDRFPPLPEIPLTPLLATFRWWDSFLQRFPAWTHPVFNGAAIVTVMVAIRVAFSLTRGASWQMLLALGVGAALGAYGGLAYSALRPYVAAGGAQRVIAYLLVLGTYLALGAAMGGFSDAPGLLLDPTGVYVLLAVSGVVCVLWLVRRPRSS
jgi:hypothetical protein